MCVLLEQDPARKLYATGHHNIVNVPGTDEWIIAYHRFAYNPAGRWAGGDGCHREVVFAPLDYNPDGSLVPVRPQVGSYVRSLAICPVGCLSLSVRCLRLACVLYVLSVS